MVFTADFLLSVRCEEFFDAPTQVLLECRQGVVVKISPQPLVVFMEQYFCTYVFVNQCYIGLKFLYALVCSIPVSQLQEYGRTEHRAQSRA